MGLVLSRYIDNADRSASLRSTSPGLPVGARRGAFELPPTVRSAYLAALGRVVQGVRQDLAAPVTGDRAPARPAPSLRPQRSAA